VFIKIFVEVINSKEVVLSEYLTWNGAGSPKLGIIHKNYPLVLYMHKHIL
jgi:hypothetical protein